MDSPTAVDNEADWKDRYFRVLFELDEKDREQIERLAALSQPLNLLLRHIKTLWPEHDELCSAIEAPIAEGDFRASLEARTRTLIAALTPSEPHAADLHRSLARLVPAGREALEQLLERRVSLNASPEAEQTWLADMAAWFARYVTAAASSASTNDGDVRFDLDPLSRLLSNLAVAPPLDEHVHRLQSVCKGSSDQIEILREVDELAARLSTALNAERTDYLPAGPMPPVVTHLERLLERIEFPPDLAKRVDSMRCLLGNVGSAAEIKTAVDQIGDLVRMAFRQARREVSEAERFLTEVAGRLEKLRGCVSGEQESAGSGRENRDELQNLVSSNVVRIREQLMAGADLNALKSGIAENLHRINSSVDLFLAKETERANAAELKVAAMTEQLEFLENETDALRSSMREEHERATRDALTGVPNRLAYEERLQFEFERWSRYGRPLAMIVVDIDHFKSINDRFGHQAGDRVLKAVAGQLLRNVRETDFLCRLGGEEFVLLLPDTDVAHAATVAEKLRGQVANCRFNYRDQMINVAVSCGVAGFHTSDEPETVFARADEALYRAKNGGRNCCAQERLAKVAGG